MQAVEAPKKHAVKSAFLTWFEVGIFFLLVESVLASPLAREIFVHCPGLQGHIRIISFLLFLLRNEKRIIFAEVKREFVRKSFRVFLTKHAS